MLTKYPKTGTLVRFEPPENAYSVGCAQDLYQGQTGLIYRVDCDSFAMVLFGKRLLIVNTAYLTLA